MQKPSVTPSSTVLIVGGGTAGVHAAAALRSTGVHTVIIEPTGCHQFLTRLAAIAAGSQPVDDASVPLDVLFPEATVERGRVVSIEDDAVTLDDGRILAGDAVIVTAGAEPAKPPITGLDHALTLRSAADALEIRRATESDEPVVIIGGGPTGCQLAGSLKVVDPDRQVTVIERSSALLTAFHPSLGSHTQRILEQRGVRIVFDSEADRIDSGGVDTARERHDGIPVWTGGFTATMEHFELGPTDEGRLEVDAAGLIAGRRSVFAAGDCAAHRDADGEVFAMSAQIAAQTGRGCGTNVRRLLDGRPTTALRPKDRGWVVDLGGGLGVADLSGLRLASPGLDRVAALLHTFIDWRNLFQIGGPSTVLAQRPRRSTELENAAVEVGDLQALVS